MLNLIEEKILKIIKQNIKLKDPLKEIGLDEDLSLLGVNSISFVKIVVALEDEFKIEFDDDMLDWDSFMNAKVLANYIKSKKGIECEVNS